MYIKILFKTAFLLILPSCSSFKEKISLSLYQPNEFETLRNDPLEIPSSLRLESPEEGSIRRKETTAEKAKLLLVGMPEKKGSDKDHEAEKVLLKQIDAEKRDPNIRRRINQDNNADLTLQEKIQKTLVFWKKHEKVSIIDPHEEAKKTPISSKGEEK